MFFLGAFKNMILHEPHIYANLKQYEIFNFIPKIRQMEAQKV